MRIARRFLVCAAMLVCMLSAFETRADIYEIKLKVSADKLGNAKQVYANCKLYDRVGQKGVVVAFSDPLDNPLKVTNGKLAPQFKTVTLKTDQPVKSWICELMPDPPTRKFSSRTGTAPDLKVTPSSKIISRGNLD